MAKGTTASPRGSRLQLTRPPVTARGGPRSGVVAGKMGVAVDAGRSMLAAGGNAIDAAVATAFAMGVAEPWMNGLGGGGYMVIWLAAERRALVIEYPMVAPANATPDMYKLVDRPPDAANFGWRSVAGNANSVGHQAVAVPGTTAGLAHALARYGTMSLADVIAPAIAIADQGIHVTWHTTYRIAADLENLRRFPATAALFLRAARYPPYNALYDGDARIRNPQLAQTLRRIAQDGVSAIHDSDVTDAIVEHLQSGGSRIARSDFTGYQVTESDGITVDLGGYLVHLPGKGTGGTSIAQTLLTLARAGLAQTGQGSVSTMHTLAQASRQAFTDRFAFLADPDAVDVPLDEMLSARYATESFATIDPRRAIRPTAASAGRLGVRHGLASSLPEYSQDGSTTHLGVIDGDGNAVSLTQTLLSLWGSRVVIPETGMLMNNGMMWFDPEPGHPNSAGSRKRPLANMAPMLVSRHGDIIASIGSSGGRKILDCNTQILLNHIVYGMDIHAALEAPRQDTSTPDLRISDRFAKDVIDGLRDLGHTVVPVDETRLTGDFASPVAIARAADGTLTGAADPWYAPATVMGIDS